MTTIVAVQHKDKVVIGADSLVTASRKYNHPKMVKISERGGYLIAGAGEVAACDIAQHIWEPPTPTASDKKDLYHFMIATVIPSLKKAFKDNDYKWDKEDGDEETKFAFLIAVEGEVFDIADDFAVCLDDKGFYGIGSGSSLAIGALRTGSTIKDALEIAADIDPYTAGPFIFHEQFKKKKVATKSKS
jgi:ATP-dependent protease HslVU (ClpYQ) peptidase subunit